MSYKRNIFEKGFSEIKRELFKETNNYHTDTYTNKPLKPGEPWDFEHIISAKEFSELGGVEKLPIETQSKILNDRCNIGFTLRTINKSKSKYPLNEWVVRKSSGRTISNGEFYGVNVDKVQKIRKEVLQFLKEQIGNNL
jgi:hypothetical protein